MQHESDDDAGEASHAASVPSPSSTESNGRQMAVAGPHPRSGDDQGHIQGNACLGQGASLDTVYSGTESGGPNEPATVAGKKHPARESPPGESCAQPVTFERQNTHRIPLTTPESQTVETSDDDAFFTPSSTPMAADDPLLPIPSADTQTEWSEINEPTSILSLPLELRKKIYAYLLVFDMVSAEEEATTVLPGNGFGSSLGLHLEILRANRQIYGEALDVIYKENDWLLISIEDEAAEHATFELLRMPKRRPFNVCPKFSPFMEVRMSVGRSHGYDRFGGRTSCFQSRNPARNFILDLASFNRLCSHRIYMNARHRQETHLQVWHSSYHPDEPRHTASHRGLVEQILGRMDSKGMTRWYVSQIGDDHSRSVRTKIAFVNNTPSPHETRPQTPRHILHHVSSISRSASEKASRNDDGAVRFLAMECLRHVHACTLDWRDKHPLHIAPAIRETFTQVARLTTPLVLRGIEITIAQGNITQARNAARVLENVLRKRPSLPSLAGADMLNMTTMEHACLVFLGAKACRKGGMQGVVTRMETLLAGWSDIPAHTLERRSRYGMFVAGTRLMGEAVDREMARYNYEVTYLPMLDLSVEQFLNIGELEKRERVEGVVVDILDFRLHNWMGLEKIEAVGPCWAWRREE